MGKEKFLEGKSRPAIGGESRDNPIKIWGVPLWEFHTTDIDNDKLCEDIYNLEKNDPRGVIKSNMNGWHSRGGDIFDQVKDVVKDIVNENVLQSFNYLNPLTSEHVRDVWAVVNKKGSCKRFCLRFFRFLS